MLQSESMSTQDPWLDDPHEENAETKGVEYVSGFEHFSYLSESHVGQCVEDIVMSLDFPDKRSKQTTPHPVGGLHGCCHCEIIKIKNTFYFCHSPNHSRTIFGCHPSQKSSSDCMPTGSHGSTFHRKDDSFRGDA